MADLDLAEAEQLIEDWLAEHPAELFITGGSPMFAFTPEELVRMVAGVLAAVRDTEEGAQS